jgi:hypothetical protein
MSIKRQVVLALLVLLISVAACGPKTEGPPSDSPLAAPDSPLPAPTATLSAMDSPLPTPTRGPSTEGHAAVLGLLTLTNPESAAPQDDGIYLVEIDPDAGMVLPAIDPENSLQAEVDEVTGQFFFDDVEAGLYSLVALTLSNMQLSIRRMDTGEPQTVMIGEEDLGQVIDLGRLVLP